MKSRKQIEDAHRFIMSLIIKHHYTTGEMSDQQFTILTGMQVALRWAIDDLRNDNDPLQDLLDGKPMAFQTAQTA